MASQYSSVAASYAVVEADYEQAASVAASLHSEFANESAAFGSMSADYQATSSAYDATYAQYSATEVEYQAVTKQYNAAYTEYSSASEAANAAHDDYAKLSAAYGVASSSFDQVSKAYVDAQADYDAIASSYVAASNAQTDAHTEYEAAHSGYLDVSAAYDAAHANYLAVDSQYSVASDALSGLAESYANVAGLYSDAANNYSATDSAYQLLSAAYDSVHADYLQTSSAYSSTASLYGGVAAAYDSANHVLTSASSSYADLQNEYNATTAAYSSAATIRDSAATVLSSASTLYSTASNAYNSAAVLQSAAQSEADSLASSASSANSANSAASAYYQKASSAHSVAGSIANSVASEVTVLSSEAQALAGKSDASLLASYAQDTQRFYDLVTGNMSSAVAEYNRDLNDYSSYASAAGISNFTGSNAWTATPSDFVNYLSEANIFNSLASAYVSSANSQISYNSAQSSMYAVLSKDSQAISQAIGDANSGVVKAQNDFNTALQNLNDFVTTADPTASDYQTQLVAYQQAATDALTDYEKAYGADSGYLSAAAIYSDAVADYSQATSSHPKYLGTMSPLPTVSDNDDATANLTQSFNDAIKNAQKMIDNSKVLSAYVIANDAYNKYNGALNSQNTAQQALADIDQNFPFMGFTLPDINGNCEILADGSPNPAWIPTYYVNTLTASQDPVTGNWTLATEITTTASSPVDEATLRVWEKAYNAQEQILVGDIESVNQTHDAYQQALQDYEIAYNEAGQPGFATPDAGDGNLTLIDDGTQGQTWVTSIPENSENPAQVWLTDLQSKNSYQADQTSSTDSNGTLAYIQTDTTATGKVPTAVNQYLDFLTVEAAYNQLQVDATKFESVIQHINTIITEIKTVASNRLILLGKLTGIRAELKLGRFIDIDISPLFTAMSTMAGYSTQINAYLTELADLNSSGELDTAYNNLVASMDVYNQLPQVVVNQNIDITPFTDQNSLGKQAFTLIPTQAGEVLGQIAQNLSDNGIGAFLTADDGSFLPITDDASLLNQWQAVFTQHGWGDVHDIDNWFNGPSRKNGQINPTLNLGTFSGKVISGGQSLATPLNNGQLEFITMPDKSQSVTAKAP